MGSIKKFEDLEIWQSARLLCKQVLAYIRRDKFAIDYKLVNQLNGSAGSVMDNIAEGFERGSKNEFIQFLGYAKGSAAEAKSQLYRALDREYITQSEFEDSYEVVERICKGCSKLISYLNQSGFKGEKFKNRVEEPEGFYSILSELSN